MRSGLKRDANWTLAFVTKILGWIVVLNLTILPILWILKIPHLFTLALTYEALFILIIGVFQILGSYIYKESSIPYRWGARPKWWDYRRFARLKPEERQRCRQEGLIMVIIGLVLLFGIIIAHLCILAYS